MLTARAPASISWAVALPRGAEELRAEVRSFLKDAKADGTFEPVCDAWLTGFSPSFSRLLAQRCWIGMTWSRAFGGHERSAVERFVVLEELLASGAPVAAHWVADRQSGPQIFKYGTKAAKEMLLPAIARGECFFSIGMSEPNSGSDLASVRTRADRVHDGWKVNGAKVWTSHAHRTHYATVLCRTAEGSQRRDGLSVLVVDLTAPGVTVRPIPIINGHAHFAELVLEDVFVPDEMLLGAEGAGWKLVTSELSLERSGPERILSTFPLLDELVRAAPSTDEATREVGFVVSELWVLRRLSLGVAAAIDAGRDPVVEAALVKDLGTAFERRVIDLARRLVSSEPSLQSENRLEVRLAEAILAAPGFTLRGGTTEILRGIVARNLLSDR